MIICVFGDSLAYGAWDKEGGWVQRLRKFLDEKNMSDDDNFYIVYNLGISGINSDHLIQFFESEIKTRVNVYEKDMLILVEIGTNDAQSNADGIFRVPVEKYEKNVKKMIEISKKYGSKIAFLGNTSVDESKTNPIPWNTKEFYKNKDIEKIFSVLKKVCKKEKIDYIELGKISLHKDGIHPNSEGHKIIFEAVKDFLIKNKII